MKIKVSKIISKLDNLALEKPIEEELDNLSINKFYDEEMSDNEDSFKEYEKKWELDSNKEYQDVIKYLNILNKIKKDITKNYTKHKEDYKFLFKKMYYKAHIFKKNISFDRNHETYRDENDEFYEILEEIQSKIEEIINTKKIIISKTEMLKNIKLYQSLFITIKNFVNRSPTT